jgi:hypothetical protein
MFKQVVVLLVQGVLLVFTTYWLVRAIKHPKGRVPSLVKAWCGLGLVELWQILTR